MSDEEQETNQQQEEEEEEPSQDEIFIYLGTLSKNTPRKKRW